MITRTPGRHRAARKAITPLTRAAQGLSGAARRGALVAAGSGLAVSLLSIPSDASPVADAHPATAEIEASPLAVEAAAAQNVTVRDAGALEATAAQAVRVAADSKLALEAGTIKVTPAPEPEPEPEPEPAPEPEPEPEPVAEAAEPAEETAAPEPAPAAEEPAAPVQKTAPATTGSEVLSIAKQYIGVPYLWGGSTPAGFDCSGFTSYVYAQVGIDLPRTSSEQRYAGTVVSAAEARPGDLIWSPGHIAIYAGGGMQIEAPVPGETVRHSQIWQSSPTYIRVG
ncbi:C40 family peptidase [Myceligenerans xiligouense]|uniref:Cell wall-associated NlpC family hydrolase n=1 Tax=Myceligenerans xiligouense TaxID=253184 RepID=A0A3N4ZJ11_9MICO|nr:C40 family peptidase [Myceligenerans xiligouense]RPF20875.1 cell wall-associated NlpC family hydrolase [Myceligenerans xiligouense]